MNFKVVITGYVRSTHELMYGHNKLSIIDPATKLEVCVLCVDPVNTTQKHTYTNKENYNPAMKGIL